LETKLVDRMLAVCRTHVISEEQLRNATSRREQLRRTAADLAMAAAKHLAQKAKAVWAEMEVAEVVGGEWAEDIGVL
jgi:hypothetical protein